jgi:antitoxin component YwqK of YwqJK toxin-antitoxin module
LWKKNGYWTIWYDHAQKSSIRNYIDGNKYREMSFLNNKYDGLYTVYHKNGKKKKEGKYKKGKKVGELIY